MRFILVWLLFVNIIYAQNFATDCPEISEADWALTDTSAVTKGYFGVVLCNYAKHTINRSPSSGYGESTSHYLFRIKILSDNPVAKNEVGIFVMEVDKDDVTPNIAIELLRKVGDKIEQVKADLGDVIKTPTEDGAYKLTYAVPNLQVGDILTYKSSSKRNTSLYWVKWNYQSQFPVKWSSFNFESKIGGTFTLLSHGNPVPYYVKETSPHDVSFKGIKTNIPAFEELPYSRPENATKDNITLVFYSAADPEPVYNISRFTKWFFRNSVIADGLKKDFPKIYDLSKSLTNQDSTMLLKSKRLFAYARDEFAIEEDNSDEIKVDMSDAIEKKRGTEIEQKLFLVHLLRGIGLKSTLFQTRNRSRGELSIDGLDPNLSINERLVYAQIDGKDYALNPNTKKPFPGLLKNEMNGLGIVLDNDNPELLRVLPEKAVQQSVIEANLTADGTIEGTLSHSQSGFGSEEASALINKDDSRKYLLSYVLQDKDASIKSVAIRQATMDMPLEIEAKFKTQNQAFKADSNLIVSPNFIAKWLENPFVDEHRSTYIDFIYPRSYTLLVNIALPEAYKIAELPEPLSVRMPQQGGSYIQQMTYKEETHSIEVLNRFILNKDVYHPDMYPFIKKMFEMLGVAYENKFTLMPK